MKPIDKVLTIMKKTHDGNDLAPQHLKLTELAVNGFLNDKGLRLLDELYRNVEAGQYKRPDYLGIEYMDRDQEGYVYFKGQSVEHYSSSYAYSLAAKADLKVLQAQCLFLESKGLPVKQALQCNWALGGRYAEDFCKTQKEKLDETANGNMILFSKVKTPSDEFLLPGHPTCWQVIDSKQYQDVCAYRDRQDVTFSVTAFSYGKKEDKLWRDAADEELDHLNCCFDYLKDQGYLRVCTTAAMNKNRLPGVENEHEEDCEL